MVRYSRFWPSTSRDSFLTIVPAPWCGYTTLSQTLYKPELPSCRRLSAKRAGAVGRRPRSHHFIKNHLETHPFPGLPAALKLQIAVDEVVLLEPPQAFADLACPDGPHTVHGLQVALRGPDDGVEAAQVGHDPADHLLRKARDVREDPVAAGLDRMVERVRSVRIAEQLGQAVELQQILVGERLEPFEREGRLGAVSRGVVVADDCVPLPWNVADELLELEA